MTLFDPAEYEDPEAKPKRKGGRKLSAQVTPIHSDGTWIAVSQVRRGVIEFAHRQYGSPNAHGAITTRCDKVGRLVERFPVGTIVHPCPICLSYKARRADSA